MAIECCSAAAEGSLVVPEATRLWFLQVPTDLAAYRADWCRVLNETRLHAWGFDSPTLGL